MERLQKAMAAAGVASRRKCEELILAGRVKVNGFVVTELGTKVTAEDVITVDGLELKKENYDACDSLICALAYVNINHHRLESPVIVSSEIKDNESEIQIKYTTKIWDRQYEKMLILKKSEE